MYKTIETTQKTAGKTFAKRIAILMKQVAKLVGEIQCVGDKGMLE